MAIAFAYTESTNTVVQTGGTSGTPADETDFVAADRGDAALGTPGATLKAAAVAAAGMTLTYPVRPVEQRALRLDFVTAQDGGADVSGDESVDFYGTTFQWTTFSAAEAVAQTVLSVTDASMFRVNDVVRLIDISAPATTETATITAVSLTKGANTITVSAGISNAYVAGDIVGINQTETINTSAAHGAFFTSLAFGQLAYFDCNGYDGTNTIAVTQPIWGVIRDFGNGVQYQIDSIFNIGDASTATYFGSKTKQVYFSLYWSLKLNAVLTIGELSNSTGVNGSDWNFSVPAGSTSIPIYNAGTFNCYGSALHCRGGGSFILYPTPTGIVVDSTFTQIGTPNYGLAVKNLSMTRANLILSDTPAGGLQINSGVSITDCKSNADLIASYSGTSHTIEKMVMTYPTVALFVYAGITVTLLDMEEPNVLYINNAFGIILLSKRFNAMATDNLNSPLQSVTVTANYDHIVQGSDSKTYRCIQDHTAVDATHKPITGTDWASFWELLSSGNPAYGNGGVWETGVAYKTGEPEFSVSTVADGTIAEQTIEVKRWTGTSELKRVRLYTFPMSKAGYETIVKKYKYLVAPTAWDFEMQHVAGARLKLVGMGAML